MLNYMTLNSEILSLYEQLTFPHYASLLKNPLNTDNLIAIGANVLGGDTSFFPVGLILAKIASNEASILSIYVEPSHRHLGIGSKLYELLEEELIQKNCQKISIDYMSNSDTTIFLQKLLKKQSFKISDPIALYVYYTPQGIQNIPIVTKTLTPPKNFEIVPIQDLTEQDLETYKKISSRPDFPQELGMISTDFPLEPITSGALKKNGVLIGWLMTHSLNNNMIRYSSLYIEPSENQLYSLCLINRALQRHYMLPSSPMIIQSIPYKFQNMIKLAKKKWVPYSFKTHDGLQAHKMLSK